MGVCPQVIESKGGRNVAEKKRVEKSNESGPKIWVTQLKNVAGKQD